MPIEGGLYWSASATRPAGRGPGPRAFDFDTALICDEYQSSTYGGARCRRIDPSESEAIRSHPEDANLCQHCRRHHKSRLFRLYPAIHSDYRWLCTVSSF